MEVTNNPDKTRHARITWASEIDPYPPQVEPYPAPESYSARVGLQVFDLITPDGDRSWVTAGWDDHGKLRAWTVTDFVANRQPSKAILDHPKHFAPLTRINNSPDLREDFVEDYAALNHRIGEQSFHFGISEPHEWVGAKIHPYKGGGEHLVRDCDTYSRLLIVDPVRAGNRADYKAVDVWEVTASWHQSYSSRPCKPRPASRRPSVDGQYLYRLYTKGGALLYVGITDNVFRRWKEHSREKPWWGEVQHFTQDWYPDRTSVEAAERHAITMERPLYNVAGASKRG